MIHPPQRSLVSGAIPGSDQQLLRDSLMLGPTSEHINAQQAAMVMVSQDAESTVVELPPFAGLRVVKETFHLADWTLEEPIAHMSIEDRVEA